MILLGFTDFYLVNSGWGWDWFRSFFFFPDAIFRGVSWWMGLPGNLNGSNWRWSEIWTAQWHHIRHIKHIKTGPKTTRIDIKQAIPLHHFLSWVTTQQKSSNKKDFFSTLHHHFFTASHCPCEKIPGHAEAVRLLLEAGAMVEAEDRFEMTPLGWAAFAGGDQKSTGLVCWGKS